MLSRICVLLSLVFVLSACGPKEGAGNQGVGAAAPAMDMSKPYLTEKKVEGVIAILKEKPEFWGARGPLAANAEMNAVAKKYGFSDSMDLSASLYRVGMGAMQAGMAKQVGEMDKNPNMTPEAKKMMQDQVKTAMQGAGQINAADLKFVEKYFDQIQAVSNKK
jgi:hypothetical protein